MRGEPMGMPGTARPLRSSHLAIRRMAVYALAVDYAGVARGQAGARGHGLRVHTAGAGFAGGM